MKHQKSKTRTKKTQRNSPPKPTVEVKRALGPILNQVPVRWAWHYKTLLRLKNNLVNQRNEKQHDVSEPIERHSMDIADSATDEFDHALAVAELSSEQNMLYEVDQALQRIARGAYGICEESGQPIPAARLKAAPWTRFAKEVQSRLERKGALPTIRLGEIHAIRTESPTSLEDGVDEVESPLPDDETLNRISLPRVGREQSQRVKCRPKKRHH